MVGALADWFAVTALFRRPLGLPIPHTAIIPNRKDAIGSSLSEFVATNFLSEAVVREKLAGFSVAKRIGEFLSKPESAERVTAELATAVRGISNVLSDDQVADLLESMARRKIAETKIGPPLGRIAAEVFERGDHHPLVDFIVDRCYEWIRDNYTAVSRVVSQRAPSWSPRFLDGIVADRIYNEVLAFARAVKTDPEHQLRLARSTGSSAEFAQRPADRPGDHRAGRGDQGPDRRQHRGALAGGQRLDVDQGRAAAGRGGPGLAAAAVGDERV